MTITSELLRKVISRMFRFLNLFEKLVVDLDLCRIRGEEDLAPHARFAFDRLRF